MSMMRPRNRTCPSPRRQPGPTARRAVAFVLLAAASALAGCSGDGALSLPLPPNPQVPEVTGDSHPSLGTTTRAGMQPLTEADRAKLQSDLEHASQDNVARADAAAQAAATPGN